MLSRSFATARGCPWPTRSSAWMPASPAVARGWMMRTRPVPFRDREVSTMITKTFTATVTVQGSTSFIPLDFDPKAVFGKVRAPVTVTVNGYTYRSTIAAMGGPPCIPLRRSNREAAGLHGGETVEVRLALDTA